MEKGFYVKDINGNAQINLTDSLFEVRKAVSALTKRGDPFWRLSLGDASGAIEAVIWSPVSTSVRQLAEGLIVCVSGKISSYNGAPQIDVRKIAVLGGDELASLNRRDFRTGPDFDPDAMQEATIRACEKEFIHPAWRKFVFSILENDTLMDRFKKSRAAKHLHHAYEGGLLEHSLSVFQICGRMAGHYGDFLDRQTLLAAALLHDIGKIRELSPDLGQDYTDIGRLQGHIFLGLELLEPYLRQSGLEAPLAGHFKHLVLSHHGQLEFGSPCLPQTPEAFTLHFADDLDAKMARCKDAFKNVSPEAGRWSDWQGSLNRFLYLSDHTSDFS